MSRRPDYCPIGNEPCQSMCDTPCTVKRRPTDEAILRLIKKQPVRQHHGAAASEYRLFDLIDFARAVLDIDDDQAAPRSKPAAREKK